MACDLGPVYGLLSAAAVSIALAIGFVVAAAAANNSFFGAGASPALIIAAGVASLAAVGSLAGARAMIENYFACMGSPAACQGALSNLLNVIAGLMTVLSIQATASFVVAGVAWIPWAGAAPMYVILGALIVQAALIPTAVAFVTDFISCVEEAARSAVGSGTGPLVAVVALAVLWLGVGYLFRTPARKGETSRA
jgi:hypothetical protein